MKRIGLRVVMRIMTVFTAVSCSKVQSDCDCEDGDKVIPVTFTMSTPAGEAVPYGTTRATQDEAEWSIHKLALYVYAVDESGKGSFLRSYATDAAGDQAIQIVSNGAGTYTFTLRAPVSDLKASRRFVFVANDAFATPQVGESQDELQQKLATVVLEEGNAADLLSAADKGIAMTGIAQSGSSDVITVTPGVKCEVHLQRIVARVDVQNNTPNLVIKSIELQQTAPKGYLFPHDPVVAADEGYITEAMNTQVPLGSTYDEQTDLKKVFYLYERTNEDGNGAQVKITYTVNNSNGEVIVPFRKTSDGQEFVNIERNTLYTIILGNGQPITTNPVQFTLKVEDWNVVDMEESVDPGDDEQAKLNAALKVNMFTPYNAKEFNLDDKTITSFYDKLAVSDDDCPWNSYVSGSELIAANAVDNDAVFTGPDGNHYRLPTQGELMLLAPVQTESDDEPLLIKRPYWNTNAATNITGGVMSTDPFQETLYFKNKEDHFADDSHSGDQDSEYTLQGESQLALGSVDETFHFTKPADASPDNYTIVEGDYDMRPVYGLRFKGTSQYAAYRWESCPIADQSMERYLSIKIKALKSDDQTTTLSDVSNEAFWKDGFIEFKFPAVGYFHNSVPSPDQDNSLNRGLFMAVWASTYADASSMRSLDLHVDQCYVGRNSIKTYFPLRFVRVE